MVNMIRESAETYGWQTLSDIDLLTIVTGKVDSAVMLKEYLDHSKCSVDGLMKLKIEGIGRSTAMKIKALYTLFGRNRVVTDRKQLTSSIEMYQELRGRMENLDHEEIWLLMLNHSLNPLKKVCLFKGGMCSATFDVRLAMKSILETEGCSTVVMAHNHPSGGVSPSSEDKNVTNSLMEACRMFSIRLVDHIIVGDNKYYSFSDEGLLN